MDFVKALTYPFDDENWLKKLGIAVLVSLAYFIPVVGSIPAAIILQGWLIETIKRVKDNHPDPLADWDDFGGIFSKGLSPFLASILYQVPTLIFACIMASTLILPAMGGESSDMVAGLASVTGGLLICCSCLILFYVIAATLVYAGGLIRFVDKPEFGTFMEFGENLALVRNNIGDFLMVALYILLAGLLIVVASSVTFGLGSLVATAFMAYFTAHILGQLAQKVSPGSVPQV
ncbi:MAG: DUF4013 domain-containing protein [Anaerolineae bacterium]|nr:DUF4013 domain-containing protein [Anaerolineae bacterium]